MTPTTPAAAWVWPVFDVRCGRSGVGDRGQDGVFLRPAVRRCEAVAGAVLGDRAAPEGAEPPMTVGCATDMSADIVIDVRRQPLSAGHAILGLAAYLNALRNVRRLTRVRVLGSDLDLDRKVGN
jgi:hypothetical protein